MTKIAILGTAPMSRALAPFDDNEWKIWACSPGNAMGVLKRVDVWFELHAMQDMRHDAYAPSYFAWLNAQSFPVVMQEEKNQFVPRAQAFPLEKMIEKFGRNWFTSSIAHMLALAIAKETTTEIALFGVDMAHTSEKYGEQRAGCVRMIEYATARNIKVTIPRESSLGTPTPIYGYAEASPMGRRLQVVHAQASATMGQLQADINRLTQEAAYFRGAIEQLDYMRATWVDGRDAELEIPPMPIEAEIKARADAAAAAAAPPPGVPMLHVVEGEKPEKPEVSLVG